MTSAVTHGNAVAWALGLLLVVSPALPSASGERPESALRALVDGYAHAIEANHLELAMTYLHAASPHRTRLEAELEDQLSWSFERAQTLSFGPAQSESGTLSAPVVQRVVRVFGMKFVHEKRRSVFVFRRQRGAWQIWDIRSREE